MLQFIYYQGMQVSKCDSPVTRMTQEKFAFSCHGLTNVFFAIDIFLAPINNSNVT